MEHKKNLYLQRLRSWPATRETERTSSFESILVFFGQWLEKLVFVGQWLEMLAFVGQWLEMLESW